MISSYRLSGLLGLIVALAGCQPKPGSVCVDVDSVQASIRQPKTAAGWALKLEGCLGRWGYSLANTEGSIDDLAHAVVGGCQDAMQSMVSTQAAEDLNNRLASVPFDEALADARRSALEKAAFYVAVGRQGKCPSPSSTSS